jgi:hypothetical protein
VAIVAGADDDLAAKLREAILWCETNIRLHAQWIGTISESQLQPNETALALIKMLVDLGLGNEAAKINIPQYSSHQKIVGLLTTYKMAFIGAFNDLKELPANPSNDVTSAAPAPARRASRSRRPLRNGADRYRLVRTKTTGPADFGWVTHARIGPSRSGCGKRTSVAAVHIWLWGSLHRNRCHGYVFHAAWCNRPLGAG